MRRALRHRPLIRGAAVPVRFKVTAYPRVVKSTGGERADGQLPADELELCAQVYFDAAGDAELTGPGREENTRGYVVVRACDLERAEARGFKISYGDRITRVGRRDRVLYVSNDPRNSKHDFGHFASAGGAEYVQINFQSRSPLGSIA